MSKILISGGAGFIASSLAARLLSTGNHTLTLVDNLATGDLRKVPKHPLMRFVKCDVNRYQDIAAIMTSTAFDYVFHYAAVVGVKRTLDNPILVLNDIRGIQNILELSKNTAVKRVFYTSSSEVYGEPVELPQNEHTTPLNSRLPYAVVKNVGEAFCRSFQKEYGLDFTVLRLFNTYGPKQSTDFVISRFLRAALGGKPLTIYGDGKQTRTFCYVDDNVDAVAGCMERDKFVNDVINIGNEKEISVLELAKVILDVTGSSSTLEFLPPLKEGDMTRRMPDNSKMKEVLDRPMISLEEGIRRMIKDPLFRELNGI